MASWKSFSVSGMSQKSSFFLTPQMLLLRKLSPWTRILVKSIIDEKDAIADDDDEKKKECDFQGRRSFVRA